MFALIDIVADGATGQPGAISGGTEAALIGGVIALANIIGELAKAAIGSAKARKNGNGKAAPNEPRSCTVCQTQVQGIHEMVTRTDGDGRPMIYASHVLVERMTEATTELRNVAASQERLLRKLEQGVTPRE